MKPPKTPGDEGDSKKKETEIEVVLWEDLTAEERADITWGITTSANFARHQDDK